MSKVKATGSSKLGRDSRAQRLGVKLYAGQKIKTGMIIVRQRGTKFLPGNNVRKGKDDTLYAMKEGIVGFTAKRKRGFDGSQRIAKIVNVEQSGLKAKLETLK